MSFPVPFFPSFWYFYYSVIEPCVLLLRFYNFSNFHFLIARLSRFPYLNFIEIFSLAMSLFHKRDFSPVNDYYVVSFIISLSLRRLVD
jgi:hypothetical protein